MPDTATQKKGNSIPSSGHNNRTKDEDTQKGELPQNSPNHWVLLVERISRREDAAIEELYRLFSKGIRYYIYKQLGSQELEDKVHDTFLIVVQAIQRGDLREPERLMGFVRTVVRRQIASSIDRVVKIRRDCIDLKEGEAIPDLHSTPEETAISQQNIEIARKTLNSISQRDREILIRFYLLEQDQQQICSEMQLTETQFRLLKSRAKQRFGDQGKKRIIGDRILNIFARKGVGKRDCL